MGQKLGSVLIGHTGFVGGNLARQHFFDACFRSTDIAGLRGAEVETVVCAGVQAKKWWANQEPEADWAGIQSLLEVLQTVQAGTFVLISTVDVYPSPSGVTESTPITGDNHAYGRHRWQVEEFVRRQFPVHHILRLPGLFGRGLKKNVIYDLLHDNCLDVVNPDAVFQYYWLEHLWDDIGRMRTAGLPLLNLATEPVPTRDILEAWFPEQRDKVAAASPFKATYDMRTDHASLWGCPMPGYLYDRGTVLQEIGRFLAEERGL